MTRPVVESTCPLCGANQVSIAIEGAVDALELELVGSSRRSARHGQILRCQSCGFAFSRVRPSDTELLRLYGAMDPALYEAEQAGRERTAKRHLQFVSRFMRPGRLLDVGCASGAFLSCAIRAGWKVAGVEPSSALAESAKRATNGYADIQCCGLQEAHFEEGWFDAITLWDVLEHVPDPIAFARACRNLLKPGGILFVNVPDIGSNIARLLAGRWPLLLPEHLNYFNTSTLHGCAEAAGFRVIRFSSRMASFSIGYVLHRLAQHDLPGARWASTRLKDSSSLSRVVVSLPLGESLSAWRLASQDQSFNHRRGGT